MNIFCLERSTNAHGVDWRASARSLDDLRLSKQMLESVQMISTALWTNSLARRVLDPPMRPTSTSHPCTRWAVRSFANCEALVELADEAAKEWAQRFGWIGPEFHGGWIALQQAKSLMRTYMDEWKTHGPTDPPIHVPRIWNSGNLVASYRAFYASKGNLRYVRTSPPKWLKEHRSVQH